MIRRAKLRFHSDVEHAAPDDVRFFRPNGELNSKSRRLIKRYYLMAYDPRCAACGRELCDEKGADNCARLIRNCLSCPKHIELVRAFAKVGPEAAPGRVQEKLKRRRKRPPGASATWFVEDRSFDSESDAEAYATMLARVLGAKIEVFVSLGGCSARQRCQIVRPGNDAECRDASFHRQRARLIEFRASEIA